MRIVLIGFMGCGKSTIGKELAEGLGFGMIDTDALIESNEKTTINEIFSRKGEEYFRDLETSLAKDLSSKYNDCIISVGGGLPVRIENREYLKEAGRIIYLRASIDTLETRLLGDTTRPLLKEGNLRERITKLMDSRASIYEELADIIIDTDELSVSQVVISIKDKLGAV